MRYSVCNQLKICLTSVWLLANGLVTYSCAPLQPSGGRKPVGEKPPVEEKPPVIPLKPNDQKPKEELTPLKVLISVALKNSIFSEKINPVLQGCASNGCHSVPDVIDLRSFPFKAEGSYALNDINARLGQNADPHTVQLELVKVLIDSMKTLYMPPAPADPISGDRISEFETWQALDLEQPEESFNGSFQLVVKDSVSTEICSLVGNIVNGSFTGTIDRKNCEVASIATYQIFDTEKKVVSTGEISGEQFLKQESCLIQINIE
jgi:hypothetical protein